MEALKERLESWLAKTDQFIRQKNSREKGIIFILPVVFFAFVAYEYTIPYSIKEHSKIERNLARINQDMAEYQGRLSERTDGGRDYIRNLEEANNALKNRIAELDDANRYIDAKMNELDFLEFSPKNWSAYLHTLTGYATRNGMDFRNLHNVRTNDDANRSAFAKVLQVDINTSGSFHNINRFLKDVESDLSLSEIDYLELTGGRSLKANITISLWGIQP